MDAKIKRLWVEALRSGKFKQVESNIYDGRAYCCLGVLCKVQGAVVRKGILRIGGEDVRYRDGTGSPEEFLKPNFAAGLRKSTQDKLADMNDGNAGKGINKRSFAEIADYIEAKL